MRKLGILTGLFSGLFGGQASADQFRSEAQFKENLVRQATMTPHVLSRLYEHGVSEESELRLEYFFYTNSGDKAASLHKVLMDLGYSGEYRRSADDNSIFVVSGWTVPIKMSEESAVAWTESMCRLGYKHDAEFDGWGTNPRQ